MKTATLDVCYICRTGQNPELIYSLRSIEKNLPHHKLWIIGSKPDGIEPDGFIETKQNKIGKWLNANDNIRALCECDSITPNFILMNDDFFIMKKTDDLQPFIRGTLQEHILTIEGAYREQINAYTLRLRSALRVLEREGIPTNSYEMHIPMILNRKKLLEIMNKYPNAGAVRSIYGNLYYKNPKLRKDVKIYKSGTQPDEEADFLSSDEAWFSGEPIQRLLAKRFPNRSRWEE